MPLSAATPEPVEIDEVFNTFDDPTRAAIQANLTEFGNALAGRGQALNAAIGDLRAAGRAARARDAQPRLARHRPRGLRPRALARPLPRWRRWPRCRASCSSTSRPPSAPSPTSRVPSSRTRSPSRPRPRTRRSRRCRGSGPSSPTPRGLFADLRPGFAALGPQAPRRSRARRRSASRRCASRPTFNAELDPTAQSLLDFNNNANVREGIDDLDALAVELNPLLAVRRPRPSRSATTRSCCSATSPATSAFGDGIGTYQRFIAFGAAGRARTTRAARSSAPANGGGEHRRTSSTPTPTRTRPRPARPRVRGRQRALHGRSDGDRKRPRQPGHHDRGADLPAARSDCPKKKKKKKKKKK